MAEAEVGSQTSHCVIKGPRKCRKKETRKGVHTLAGGREEALLGKSVYPTSTQEAL